MRMMRGSETTSPAEPTNVIWKLRRISTKKTTSTILSTTNTGTLSIVLPCLTSTRRRYIRVELVGVSLVELIVRFPVSSFRSQLGRRTNISPTILTLTLNVGIEFTRGQVDLVDELTATQYFNHFSQYFVVKQSSFMHQFCLRLLLILDNFC